MRRVRVVRLSAAPGEPARRPEHRTRATRSLILPVVLVGALAAVALPGAIAAPAATPAAYDTTVPAGAAASDAATAAEFVTGDVTGDAVAEPDDLAPKRTTLGIVLAAPTAPTETAAPPPPAVDGSAAPAAPVDTAAVAVQAAQALSGATGVRDGATGIPTTVLAAYKKAEALLAAAKPNCHLPWWVLAGIGHIESDHAYGGRVDANGTTRGRILGVLLDGSVPGTAVVRDTDGGRWDGDATYDRAVGPMQFLPGSWSYWGKDGNGDGVADPNNVFDAATAAGYLLCSAGDLSSPDTLSRAILSYNHSAAYVQTVLTWGVAYRDGATPSPDAAGAVPTAPATPTLTAPPTTPAPSPTVASTPSATTSAAPTTSRTSATTPARTTSTPTATSAPTGTTTTSPTTTTEPSPTSTTVPTATATATATAGTTG